MINTIVPHELIDTRDLADSCLVRETLESNLYPVLYNIVKEKDPEVILEIGTRYGYSLAVMLDAGKKIRKAVSIDMNDDFCHGGVSGAFIAAQHRLCKLKNSGRWSANLQFVDCNTQKVNVLSLDVRFDLAYIYGDHSFDGCIHDLNLVLPLMNTGGWIVVDDIDYCKLRSPVDSWIKAHEFEHKYYSDEGGRGRYVIFV